jgi:hypothetical protein
MNGYRKAVEESWTALSQMEEAHKKLSQYSQGLGSGSDQAPLQVQARRLYWLRHITQ